MARIIVVWETGTTLIALQDALGATSVTVPPSLLSAPGTWIDTLSLENARLLAHVNLPPRRSQRRGLELVHRLRWEWGMTAPVLFVSFETAETLQRTPYGAQLARPGHDFLRLPATTDKIRSELNAVSTIDDPDQYWRSAAATALGLFLDGPGSDPINDGPGPLISLLDYWQEGVLDRVEVADSLVIDPWWNRWSETLSTTRKRLARLVTAPSECTECLKRVEGFLASVTTCVEQIQNLDQPVPLPQDSGPVLHALKMLVESVSDLRRVRCELRADKETNSG